MSFLTPLYVLGVLAVAAPIVFHLIRRAPRGQVPFSSLMFLTASPPRVTRRSRLDHVVLLILRATALGLLAAAFARPFFRRAERLDFDAVEARRIAVLIDTSASMRRGDLWRRARARVADAIAGCRPADQLAVFAFDGSTRPVLGFDESSALDPARRRAVAEARLARLAPTWGTTNLGQALVDAVAAVADVPDATAKHARMPRRIVLVSDLQRGSRLDALGDFEWPSDVELDLKTVSEAGSNASLHPLADAPEEDRAAVDLPVRVRVANEPGSRRERFALRWVDPPGAGRPVDVDVYVPPGESRVVRVPRPPGAAPGRALRLSGDAQDFDNTLFFAAERREEATVLYVGADGADDPAGPRYYIERAFSDTPRRVVRVASRPPAAELTWESDRAVPLIVLTTETTSANAHRLQGYVRGGGTLLVVVAAPGPAATLAALAGASPRDVVEGAVDRDVMLGQVAFDHPLFAPLAGAQFNDFTKIHFWKYRRLPDGLLGEARVLARFENGDAAVIEKTLGQGRLVVLASGWHPADSQLARSSKFVPLIAALLERRDARPFDATSRRVFDRVPLPAAEAGARGVVVHKPDGAVVTLAAGGASFAGTDQPGVYTVDTAAGARTFAVNLDPMESRTTPLEFETLEQWGCRLANPARAAADRASLRQMHNQELENRQKVWRWLILAAIGVLIAETWLAGGLGRPRPVPARAEVLTT
jgi:hypothetical protein